MPFYSFSLLVTRGSVSLGTAVAFLTKAHKRREHTLDVYQILGPDLGSKQLSYSLQSPLMFTGRAVSRTKYIKSTLGTVTALLMKSGLHLEEGALEQRVHSVVRRRMWSPNNELQMSQV